MSHITDSRIIKDHNKGTSDLTQLPSCSFDIHFDFSIFFFRKEEKRRKQTNLDFKTFLFGYFISLKKKEAAGPSHMKKCLNKYDKSQESVQLGESCSRNHIPFSYSESSQLSAEWIESVNQTFLSRKFQINKFAHACWAKELQYYF